MVSNIESLVLLVATVLGALTTSVLGWLDSNTPFEAKSFYPSAIRGAIAAVLVYVTAYSGYIGTVSTFTYVGAYLSGGGFDTIINRLSGITQSKPATTPATTGPVTSAQTTTAKLIAPKNIYRLKRRLMFLQFRK